MPLRFDCHCSADRIAITLLPAQTEGDRLPDVLHRVAQDSQLWPVPVFQDDFQPSVLVQVGERKRPAVLKKIQSHYARNFREPAVVIIRAENIPLAPAPEVVRPDQLIDGVPSLLVAQRRCWFLSRFGNQLSPEKTRKVIL